MNSQAQQQNSKRLVLYFQIHQPTRLRNFSYFDIGSGDPYFDEDLDKQIICRIAEECYLPANDLLLELIEQHPNIRLSFSISGVALEQFERYAPEVIASFGRLIDTGCVEMLGETYYHSLAGVNPSDEFEEQVADHTAKLKALWGITPTFFRNTELIYNNTIGRRVAAMGFKGMFIEGVDQALKGESAWKLFHHPEERELTLIARSCGLSDDIGFRFQDGSNTLQVADYISWIDQIDEHDPVVTIGLDYETFGEHRKKDTGIFDFLRGFLETAAQKENFQMVTPSSLISDKWRTQDLSVPTIVSWADHEKDISAWLGNSMQREAFEWCTRLEGVLKNMNDQSLLEAWRSLQTSDHFYYMSTKKFADGNVHAYFSPYLSPYEAFINYMNVLSDFEILITAKQNEATASSAQTQVEAERRNDSVQPIWVDDIKRDYISHN